MRYFRPSSLSWWAGVFLVAMGFLQAAGVPDSAPEADGALWGVLEALTSVAAALTGGTGQESAPAALIGLGVAVIGLRDAMQRADDRAQDRDLMIMAMGAQQAVDDHLDGYQTPQDYSMPEGESPMPEGVVDPWGPGGSRE